MQITLQSSTIKLQVSLLFLLGVIYHFLSCVKNRFCETHGGMSSTVNETAVLLVDVQVMACSKRPLFLDHQQHKQRAYHKINKCNLQFSI